MTEYRNQILQGDVIARLRDLPDESVHCVVTSPPYWGLRDYGVEGQIGMEPTPQEFVSRMAGVFEEVRRVLRGDGTLWLNLGDSYAGNGSAYGEAKSTLQGSKQSFRMGAKRMPKRGYGLKAKDLVGIPWRVAFALQDLGWWLRSEIIWAKPNPMPSSVKDRPTVAHETIFLPSKSARYYYDHEAVREASQSKSIQSERSLSFAREVAEPARPGQGYSQHRDSRKVKVPDGWDRGAGPHGTIHREGRTKAEYQKVEILPGRNLRSVWTIPTHPFPAAHFATFPPALVEPCIKAGCPVGGVVLDPFFGSGTTGVVAKQLGRDFVGIELNPEYVAIARKRLRENCPLLMVG